MLIVSKDMYRNYSCKENGGCQYKDKKIQLIKIPLQIKKFIPTHHNCDNENALK